MRQTLLYIILIWAIMACEEEQNGPIGVAPSIKVAFKAEKSKTMFNPQRDAVSLEVTDLKALLETQTGADSLATRAKLTEKEAELAELNTLVKWLSTGTTRITSLNSPQGQFDDVEDSVNTVFRFPMDMNANQTTYYVEYFGLKDTLVIHYDKSFDSNYDRVLMKLHIDPDEIEHTFDSVQAICDDCRNNDKTYTFYY